MYALVYLLQGPKEGQGDFLPRPSLPRGHASLCLTARYGNTTLIRQACREIPLISLMYSTCIGHSWGLVGCSDFGHDLLSIWFVVCDAGWQWIWALGPSSGWCGILPIPGLQLSFWCLLLLGSLLGGVFGPCLKLFWRWPKPMHPSACSLLPPVL